MYSVTYRLNTLEKARAEFNVKRSHDDALEDQSGTSTKGTKKHDKTPLNKAEDDMNAAELALARTPADNVIEFLKKVSALAREGGIDEDAANHLKADADRLMDVEADPIIQMCEEWMTIRRVYEQRAGYASDLPHTEETPLELEEASDYSFRLEKKIMRTTPKTPQGLAMLATMYWTVEGPTCRAGTEAWAESFDNPQFALLARLREGAMRMAGMVKS